MIGQRGDSQASLFVSFASKIGFRPITCCGRSTGFSTSARCGKDWRRSTALDPELMIRILIVGYCLGIRSERRLCEEVDLNLAYRWFCRLGLEGRLPDHSTFSKTRHGRFRDSDALRRLFEMVVRRTIAEGLVGGEGFAVDASLIAADAKAAIIVDVEATRASRPAEVGAAKTMLDRTGGPLRFEATAT